MYHKHITDLIQYSTLAVAQNTNNRLIRIQNLQYIQNSSLRPGLSIL